MSNIITVIAVQLDTQKAVFLDDTAKRHTVHQTDPALARLLHELMPLLAADKAQADRTGKPQKGVKIDLSTYSMYADFEEKTGGLVKFFRAAKAKVASFFEILAPVPTEAELDAQTDVALETVVTETILDETERLTNGQYDYSKIPEPVPVIDAVQPVLRPRYEDMKQHLEPITTDAPLPADETLVAVIGNVVIPGIDALKPYIVHALKNNSEKAVTAFLQRIALVIDKKGHSIPDLMKFIELGDLPLAEDGSIIGYKILNRTTDHGKFTYVDCHSGKVHQRVGTWVRIPEKMVDPNRRVDCSHGLHVARRGYLGSFSGNVCTLIKMAPEDVVAVPEYNSNKVRTCSYFIIGELSKHVYDVLRSGKGMFNDPEAAAMLQKAISGDHIPILEEVWVEGNMGSNLVIRNTVDKDVAKKAIKADETKVVKATEAASEIDAKVAIVVDEPIDPRELNKQIKEEQAKAAAGPQTFKERVSAVLISKDAKLASILIEERKQKKKSWESLGFAKETGLLLSDIVSGFAAVSQADPISEPKAEPKKKATSVKGPKNPERKEPVSTPEAVTPLNAADQAMSLFVENKWSELWAFKKAKKKGWAAFGFTSLEVEEIEKHK